MSYELKGTLLEKYDMVVISDKFSKREFVVETKETTANGFEFSETIKFQFTQDKCNILDQYEIGQSVNVSFNVKGKRWQKNGQVNYFNNLDAWKIEKLEQQQTNDFSNQSSGKLEPEDDTEPLPF